MKNKINKIAVLCILLTLISVNCFADNRYSPADNTQRNTVDKNMDTVLPEDQSNKEVHIERTAAIRREITSADNLSTKAKNVKIITLSSGNVVLRGPVATQAEKDFIEQTAKRISGNVEVRSFLEVA